MIIIAEDDADQRLALRLALEQAGYSVREAENGRAALALQRKRPSRALLTDIFMPESDGFELVDRFKKEYPSTKIIVVSGGGRRAKLDYLESVRLLGVDAALEKPYDVGKLLTALKDLLGE